MEQYAISLLPVIPMRAEASDKSEMVSQMLFGETCEILEPQSKWSLIRTSMDNYCGWVDNKQIIPISPEEFEKTQKWTHRITEPLATLLIDAIPCVIPMGSNLPETNCTRFHNHTIQYSNPQPLRSIYECAESLLNAPYLWGGKTALGIDCSGFIQTIFRSADICLPRDASQQATVGETIPDIEQAKRGDLLFFHNASGRIIHVGLYLGNHQIIHASGKVRIDSIDATGIFNTDTQTYSHYLHSIQRVLNSNKD